MKVENNDVTSVRHIQNNNKPPVIMVTFKEKEKKNEFMKSAKQNRVSSTQFGYSGDPYPIYVGHQLTTESFNLFLEAKKLKKIGISYVWIANGDILIREKTGKPAVKITTLK